MGFCFPFAFLQSKFGTIGKRKYNVKPTNYDIKTCSFHINYGLFDAITLTNFQSHLDKILRWLDSVDFSLTLTIYCMTTQ